MRNEYCKTIFQLKEILLEFQIIPSIDFYLRQKLLFCYPIFSNRKLFQPKKMPKPEHKALRIKSAELNSM